MTRNLNITHEAEQDVSAILTKILHQDSLQTANRLVLEFKKQLKTLVDLPDSGREGRSKGTREIILQGFPYIAIFKASEASIIVIRVLFGATDNKEESIG